MKLAYIIVCRKKDWTFGGQMMVREKRKVPDSPSLPSRQKVVGWCEIGHMRPKIEVRTSFWNCGKDVHEGYNG
jgi:hypothetical protein